MPSDLKVGDRVIRYRLSQDVVSEKGVVTRVISDSKGDPMIFVTMDSGGIFILRESELDRDES